MEVLWCLLAHNRCHGLNYYHQLFRLHVKPSSQPHRIILYKQRLKASLFSLAYSEVSVFRCQAHQHAGFFFPISSSFPSVTHFQHMAALHYEKWNSRTSAADRKDTTNLKHLLYSSPNLVLKCVTFMFPIQLVPCLCLASRDRDTL